MLAPRDRGRVLAACVELGGRVSSTVIRPVPNEKLVPDADPVHKSCDRSKTDYTFSSPSTLRQTTSVLCLTIDGDPRSTDRVVRSQPGSTVLPMNQLSTASGAHCQRKEDRQVQHLHAGRQCDFAFFVLVCLTGCTASSRTYGTNLVAYHLPRLRFDANLVKQFSGC